MKFNVLRVVLIVALIFTMIAGAFSFASTANAATLPPWCADLNGDGKITGKDGVLYGYWFGDPAFKPGMGSCK